MHSWDDSSPTNWGRGGVSTGERTRTEELADLLEERVAHSPLGSRLDAGKRRRGRPVEEAGCGVDEGGERAQAKDKPAREEIGPGEDAVWAAGQIEEVRDGLGVLRGEVRLGERRNVAAAEGRERGEGRALGDGDIRRGVFGVARVGAQRRRQGDARGEERDGERGADGGTRGHGRQHGGGEGARGRRRRRRQRRRRRRRRRRGRRRGRGRRRRWRWRWRWRGYKGPASERAGVPGCARCTAPSRRRARTQGGRAARGGAGDGPHDGAVLAARDEDGGGRRRGASCCRRRCTGHAGGKL